MKIRSGIKNSDVRRGTAYLSFVVCKGQITKNGLLKVPEPLENIQPFKRGQPKIPGFFGNDRGSGGMERIIAVVYYHNHIYSKRGSAYNNGKNETYTCFVAHGNLQFNL